MYLAELHGKLSRPLSQSRLAEMNCNYELSEDILTSNVFGFLKYANRHVYLASFLQSLKLELPNEALDHAEFQFWPTYPDGTEPDLVIIAADYYILVEAKNAASFGISSDIEKHQLNREYREGMQAASVLNIKFILLAITADYSLKSYRFNQTPFIFSDPCFRWTSWQKFAKLLKDVLEKDSGSIPDRLLASDLLSLLERKNLREFNSFNNIRFMHQPVANIFFGFVSATFRGAFIGFRQALPVYIDSQNEDAIFFINRYFSGFRIQYHHNTQDSQIFYSRKENNKPCHKI